MVDWTEVRGEFPALADWTYLNTATYGQLPRPAVAASMRHYAHRDEMACSDFLSWFDDMDVVRASAARLVNCAAEDIAFANNAATALSWLMVGMAWREGDRIVTLENEFPNNSYHASTMGQRGVELVETPWSGIYEAVNERTRAVLVSTVNYTTGFRPDLATLSRWLHERDVLLYVDGTQSVGALRFDVQDVKPDMLAVHGYKWLLSPNGAAFAYISPGLRRILPPTVIGWRSHTTWRDVNQLHHGTPQFADLAERYEGGMLNFPSLYAMGASIDMMLELGPDRIEARVLDLASKCESMLRDCGATVEHPGSPVLAARFASGVDVGRLGAQLKEQRIVVSARHGRLRVSVHFYNNEDDIDRLGQALRRLV